MSDEKSKLLEAAISQIEKSYGKGSIMRLGSRDVLVPVSVIPTGCLSLDAALGVGGFPRGRVVEIYGPESGGKTTLTLHVIAEAQKLGGRPPSSTPNTRSIPSTPASSAWTSTISSSRSPTTANKPWKSRETLIRSGGVDVVVVDSVAALVPKAELEGDMGDPSMGLQARLMSQALRKLTAHRLEVAHLPDLHQPDPRKNRRDVRQPGNHHRRPRAQVLRLDPHRHSPHPGHQGRRSRRRLPHPRAKS